MKKNIFFLIFLSIFSILCAGAMAEEAEDSASSLRELLFDECGSENFCVFDYGDYDGDGISEAFALVGFADEWGMNGDLWFVSPLFVEKIQGGKAYSMAEQIGEMAPMLFRAEESYGGSGSTSYLWRVQNGAPVSMDASLLENFSYSGHGYDFYSYPSAFDACDDGTGHTWKPYYFYLDTETMQVKEYGGMNISRRDLEAYAGAAEALQSAEAEGYEIWEMIYRANGLVNVNLHSSDGYNNFLTLKLSDGAAIDVTPSENAGYYLLASEPDLAVYPTSIRSEHSNPAPSEAATAAPSAETAKSMLNPADGTIYLYDLNGDGAKEQIQLTYKHIQDYTSYCVYIADAEGVLLGGDEVIQIYDNVGESGEEFCYGLMAYAFHGGLYLEARAMFEGVMTDYMLFLPEDGRYVLKKWINNGDPSEGVNVEDMLNNVPIVYSETEYYDVVSILDNAFAEYDLHFQDRKICEHRFSNSADLSPDALIFDLSDESFPYYAVIPDPSIQSDSALNSEEALSAASESTSTGTFVATGDVNMRDTPNLAGNILTTVKKSCGGEYLGEQSTDERGVVWYFVRYNGHTGWVSSKYSSLN